MNDCKRPHFISHRSPEGDDTCEGVYALVTLSKAELAQKPEMLESSIRRHLSDAELSLRSLSGLDK